LLLCKQLFHEDQQWNTINVLALIAELSRNKIYSTSFPGLQFQREKPWERGWNLFATWTIYTGTSQKDQAMTQKDPLRLQKCMFICFAQNILYKEKLYTFILFSIVWCIMKKSRKLQLSFVIISWKLKMKCYN